MSKKGTVIIGAGLGDEGKGLMTDYFSNRSANAIVVRFNGGTQAGHTVVTPNGNRHVHGHFGSGSLNGTPTYLSKHFVVSPHVFLLESDKIISQTHNYHRPTVIVDPRCIVTTPFDVYINRAAEKSRGTNKHGSCGEGINETVERNLTRYGITVQELSEPGKLEELLFAIRDEYIPLRMTTLGVHKKYLDASMYDDNLVYGFVQRVKEFFRYIKVQDESCLTAFDDIVFEGAQGLLLDQNSSHFPYVTRSNTGIINAVEIAEEVGLEALNIVYVTRCYKTRHGVGTLLHEEPKLNYNIVDLTNKPNPYQDSIRFGHLDVDELIFTINADFNSVNTDLKLNKYIAITCLDQIPDKLTYIYHADKIVESVNKFIWDIRYSRLFASGTYLSYGPTRETVQFKPCQIPFTKSILRSKIVSTSYGKDHFIIG